MNLAFRRHYHLLVWLALAAIGLILGLGNQPIIAYSAQGDEQVVATLAQTEITHLLTTLGIH